MKLLLLIAICICLIPTSVFAGSLRDKINAFEKHAEEKAKEKTSYSYLCVADKATGFRYDKSLDKWETAIFNVEDNKYIVSRSAPGAFSWEITQVGSDRSISYCEKDFNESGAIFCEGIIGFRMNRKNLRFMNTYLIGYVTDNIKGENNEFVFKEGDNSPFFEIGKCSPL